MKKHLFGMAICLCLVSSGAAFAQTIDDIQYYNPLDGAPLPGQDPLGWNADLNGQIVTVTGVVFEFNNFSSGSVYIQNATGGIGLYDGALILNLGDEVEMTGTIGAFGGEIQIGSGVTATVLSPGNTLTPLDKTITDILSSYENVGWLTSTIGTVTSVEGGRFYMADAGDTIQV